ncbi:hypothetical protein, partial [Nitratidesulfovibrio liaohensis]|uniref:hypothetical protein n=1 Tax=Nitratidesulfovibrio liaohensis TaxID=2604158 RepID=UPI001AAE4C92
MTDTSRFPHAQPLAESAAASADAAVDVSDATPTAADGVCDCDMPGAAASTDATSGPSSGTASLARNASRLAGAT